MLDATEGTNHRNIVAQSADGSIRQLGLYAYARSRWEGGWSRPQPNLQCGGWLQPWWVGDHRGGPVPTYEQLIILRIRSTISTTSLGKLPSGMFSFDSPSVLISTSLALFP